MKKVLFLMAILFHQFANSQVRMIDERLNPGEDSKKVFSETIQSQSKISSGAKATYESGKNIHLTKGFRAKKGSVFNADIRKSISTESEEIKAIAYPNPFQDEIEVDFFLMNDSRIGLSITDVSGKIIKKIKENETFKKGFNSIHIGIKEIATGTYFLLLNINNKKQSIKLVKD